MITVFTLLYLLEGLVILLLITRNSYLYYKDKDSAYEIMSAFLVMLLLIIANLILKIYE